MPRVNVPCRASPPLSQGQWSCLPPGRRSPKAPWPQGCHGSGAPGGMPAGAPSRAHFPVRRPLTPTPCPAFSGHTRPGTTSPKETDIHPLHHIQKVTLAGEARLGHLPSSTRLPTFAQAHPHRDSQTPTLLLPSCLLWLDPHRRLCRARSLLDGTHPAFPTQAGPAHPLGVAPGVRVSRPRQDAPPPHKAQPGGAVQNE